MAGFEDAYAELFGERPTYNPIDITAPDVPRRRAIAIGLSLSKPSGLQVPSGNAFMEVYRDLNSQTPAPEQNAGVSSSDYARAFGSGAVGLASTVAGIPEYLSRQAAGTQETPLQQTFGDLTQTFAQPRRALSGMAQDIASGMSPEALQRMSREWTTLDPGKTIWQGGIPEFVNSLALQATQAAPSTLATLLPGTLMLRAGLRGGALTYLGASEGALSVGQIANNIAEEVEKAPEAELQQSPRYQQLRQSLGDAAAREQLIQEAQGAAPAIGGFVVGLISAGAGRYLEPKLTDVGGGLASRFGRGFASEAVQESTQSGAEQLAQNYAAQVYDQSRSLFEGVPEQMVQGGAIGGLLGGTTNAIAGPRAQALPKAAPTPIAEPAPAPQAAPELPASFQEVFGSGRTAPPTGPADFSEVFTMPGREPTFLEERESRDRALANPQAALQRRSALGPAIVNGAVDPAIVAAANARQDNLIQDMFQQPTGLEGPGGTDMREVWARNEQMDLPQGPPAPGSALVPAANQQGTLPLRERIRGGAPVAVEPMAAQPLQEDLTPPAGFAGAPIEQGGMPGRSRADMLRQRAYLMQQPAPTFRDENQQDLFSPPTANPQVTPDQPSAEPVGDLLAQLEELQDPDSSRKGVYLSAANIENLRRNGAFERVRGTGVPLPNFDGQGGTLIAKNRQVAEELLSMLGQGAGSLQEVLGYATGAGSGKPAGAQIAVQLRDDAGNVVRESLVGSEPEADQLAAQWERETGQQAAITSAAQAIRRRTQRVTQENQQLAQATTTKRVRRQAEEIIERELGEGRTAERAKRATRRATSEADVARRLVQLASYMRGGERERAMGDVLAPEDLEFADAKQAQQYQDLYNEYLGQQVLRNTPGNASEGLKARAKQESLRGQIGALRTVAKPVTRSERVAAVASRIDAAEVRRIRRRAEERASRSGTERDYLSDVGEYTDEQVESMPDAELTQAFAAAARFVAGRKRARKTFEEIVGTHRTTSEQRKLVKRVQNFLHRRKHGGKVKTAALTRSAEKKAGSTLPVRKGKFDTRVLSVEQPPRDVSQQQKKALADRAKQAFRGLEQSLQKVAGLIDATRQGAFAEIGSQREPDGSLTTGARQMLIARAYLRVLAEYGNALQKANNRSSALALQQIEQFNATVDKVSAYSPQQFSQKLSQLFQAESREAVRGAAQVDPQVLGKLVYPNERAKMTALSVRRNAERLARIARLEQHWSKDSYYRNHVSPLMQRLAASIAGTGQMDYKPSARELRAVQFAMRLWRNRAETRDVFYKPLHRFFRELGIDFSTLKITDDYQWSLPDDILERRYRRRFGVGSEELLTSADNLRTPVQQAEAFTTGVKSAVEALGRDVPLTAQEVEKFGKVQAVNSAINQLRKSVQNGTTLDVIRAEETFVRQMSELKLWDWTNKKLGLGKITIPGLLKDRSFSVRLQAPRLRAGTLTTKDAIEAMLELYQPVPLSREVRKDKSVGAAARTELRQANKVISVEDQIAQLMRIEAMTPEQRRLYEAFQRRDREDSQGLDLMAESLRAEPELVERGAKAVADMLEQQGNYPTLNAVVERAVAALPDNNHFRIVLDRLLKVPGLDQVYVAWDRSGELLGTRIGQYRASKDGIRTIQINREQIDKYRAKGWDPHALLLHALTHEAVHAATIGALENNPTLRMAAWSIMRQASNAFKARGLNPENIYAFRDNDVREFIAEAFSNRRLQKLLKSTMIEPKLSVWQAILQLVKNVLGLKETPDVNNVLDAVLSLTDELFTGELPTRGARAVADLRLDSTVREAVANTLDKYIQSDQTMKGLWQRTKDAATSGVLPAMSMEQIRDNYSRFFQSEGANPLADYMRAFFKRNADNSANMETADKLSRKWTEVTEQDREGSLEMSRIMTEATLHQMHPDLPLSASENAHLKSDAQKRKHVELATRWKALSEPMQDLYEDVAEYYDATLRKEVALMTLNALRGYLTKGSDAAITEQDFDYTESDVEALNLNTMEGLRDEFGGLIDEAGLKTIYKIASIPEKRVGPYFPLMRFGDFVVYAEREKERKFFGDDRKAALAYRAEQLVDDPTLDVSVRQADNGEWMAVVSEKEFRTAESRSEAEQNRREMAAMYGEGNTTPVQLKADFFRREATINSNSALGTILSRLDDNPAAQAAIKNFYLQSLSDSSFRKHELARKNRRGVDYETQHRTFANYAKQAAYYTSQLRFGWQMADALRAMEKTARAHRDESDISAIRMGEVVREINTRDKLTVNPQETSKLVRAGVELGHFMLLTSPSYWMINATQPYMVTLPWLAARTSLGAATTALTNAQKLIMSPLVTQAVESWGGAKALRSKVAAEKAFSVLEQVEEQIKKRAGARAPEYLQMLTALKRESIIDLSFVAELRDVASGQSSVAKNVLDASRIMAHLTEVNNRIMTAIAAYDIGRSKQMTHEQAVEFAKQAVSLTQFNYSSGNKPRLFQAQGPLGSLGPLIFQFMQYPQHMYALLISNMRTAMGDSPEGRKIARKTLAGIFATHLAAGGLIGAMLQPIKWAFGLAAFLFGDDDEPYDFDRQMREISAELFGTELGEIAAAGLPRALGVDLSTRMSLGTLYMVDLKADNADSFLGSLVQSFGGPVTGLAVNAFKGIQYARDGEWQKALEMIEPKALKDISKTLRYTSEGLTDATGKTILDAKELSPYQLFLQSIGLQPSEISETYARNQARKDAQQHDAKRRESLLKRFRNADSAEVRAQVAIEVAEFNKANPEQVITRSALLKTLTNKVGAEQRMQALGGNFRGQQALYAERGEFYNADEEEEVE